MTVPEGDSNTSRNLFGERQFSSSSEQPVPKFLNDAMKLDDPSHLNVLPQEKSPRVESEAADDSQKLHASQASLSVQEYSKPLLREGSVEKPSSMQMSEWEEHLEEDSDIICATKVVPGFVTWSKSRVPLWPRQGMTFPALNEVVDDFRELRPDESRFDVSLRPDTFDESSILVKVESSQENVDLFMKYLDVKAHERRATKQKKESLVLSMCAREESSDISDLNDLPRSEPHAVLSGRVRAKPDRYGETKPSVSSTTNATRATAKLKSAQKDNATDSQSDNDEPSMKTGFANFHAKVQKAAEIEFKNSDIPWKTISSSMWAAHKNMFGEACNDDCTCVFRLKDLAANVVGTAMKKVTAWTSPLNLGVNELPVGFMTQFSDKYMPKLQNKHPSESPASLLVRLLALWEKRQALRSLAGAPLHLDNATSSSVEMQPNNASYNGFLRKFKEAAKIEFRGSGIHVYAIISSMWNRHKRMFGGDCEADCQCVFQLQDLASNAVAAALKKGDDWENPLNLQKNDLPVGFVSNFSRKFFPKLKSSYPNDSAAQLFERLVRLWSLHEQQRGCGRRCKGSCPCEEVLDLSISRGPLPEEAEGTLTSISKPKSPHSTSILRKGSQCALSTQMKEYSVEFETTEPLGFYCVPEETYHGGNIHSVCKIVSVAPQGQCSKDSRLQGGTIILAIILNGCNMDIRSPRELQMAYDQASASKSRMQLVCINSDVSVDSMATANTFQRKAWSRLGYWRGKLIHGWAGGALDLTISPMKTSGSDVVTAAASCNDEETRASVSPETPVRTLSRTLDAASCQTTPQFLNSLQIHDSERQPVSSFGEWKSPRNLTTKRVGFHESIDVRAYIATSPTTEFYYPESEASSDKTMMAVEGSQSQDVSSHFNGNTTPTRKNLFEVFQSRTVTEALAVLESGAAVNVSSDDLLWLRKSSVNSSRAQIQEELQSSSDPAFVTEGRDIELKDKVLKIYLNAEKSVRTIKAIDEWECFDYCVTEVGGIAIDSVPLSSPSEVSTTCPLSSPSEVSCPLSSLSELSITCTSIPSTGEASQFHSPSQCLVSVHQSIHCNASLALVGKVKIQLKSKSCGDDNVILGDAVILTSDFHASVESYGGWSEPAAFDIVPSAYSDLQTGAYVKVSVRRGTVDAAFMDDRCNEQQKRIREIMGWISRFNSELSAEELGSCISMSANILVGGESLLHAAVRLEDYQLVEDLLVLGAKPEVRGEKFSSAVELALSMLVDCRQEEHKAILEDIVNILHAHLERANTNIAAQSEENGATFFAEPMAVSSGALPVLSTSSITTMVDTSTLPVTNGEDVLVADTLSYRQIMVDKKEGRATESKTTDSGSSVSSSQSMTSIQKHTPLYSLPTVNADLWVLPPYMCASRCSHHERSKNGCYSCKEDRERGSCKFIHIHKPWGTMLSGLLGQCLGANGGISFEFHRHVQDFSRTLTLKDSHGDKWVTAKYVTTRLPGGISPRGRQDIIFVEGDDSKVSDQGLHWYKTSDAALCALEKTVFVTFWALRCNLRPLPDACGPSLLLPAFGTKKRSHPQDLSHYTPNKRPSRQEQAMASNVNADLQHSYYGKGDVQHSGDETGVDDHSHDMEREASTGSCFYVRMQGIPWNVSLYDIKDFLQRYNVYPSQIVMIMNKERLFSGIVNMRFSSETNAQRSLLLSGEFMGTRYVELRMSHIGEFQSALASHL